MIAVFIGILYFGKRLGKRNVIESVIEMNLLIK